MSMVSCLPKPSGMAILGDRQISYEDVELEWIGECDTRGVLVASIWDFNGISECIVWCDYVVTVRIHM